MTRGAAGWLVAGALVAAPAAAQGLRVDASDPRLLARPDLAAKLASTPHAFFRFVNAGFAQETCRLFADTADSLPEVSLHGDAHVEQYAVTSIGRGLTDFDDCTRGKPVIDLVRFGASLVLAARQKGWTQEERLSLERFLEGYRDGLSGHDLSLAMPVVATRMRARFHWQHGPTLRQAQELVARAELPKDAFADGVARFAELIGFARELPPFFFEVKRIGALTMGIGSALDEKYLIVFEGRTRADDDDLVVEAKQIRDLSGNPCLRTDAGASRVLDGERTIAYEPFAYAAVVPHGGKYFWVHDWTDDYAEASIATEILTPRDLRQLAYDSGVQLGRAHPKRPDGTPDRDKRRLALQALDRTQARVRAAVAEMVARTETAWREFREGRAAAAP